eukprot:COSAG03_NODE_13258_length_509_cov_4985.534146_1_plen_81_part_10
MIPWVWKNVRTLRERGPVPAEAKESTWNALSHSHIPRPYLRGATHTVIATSKQRARKHRQDRELNCLTALLRAQSLPAAHT